MATAESVNVNLIVGGLTRLQILALRSAQPDGLLRFDGEWCPTLPVLDCPPNVARDLVHKGLAARGGEIGPAKVAVLTVTGELVRSAILCQS
jgi:hypothetical protein